MQEKTIFKVSFLLAFMGLAFLFFYAEEVDLKVVENVDAALPEETIKLRGVVQSINKQEKVLFLQLEGERVETTDIIVFPEEELFLQEGDYVEITGTVEEYHSKKEVIASTIIKR